MSYRNTNAITHNDLLPGDILLMSETNALSKLIQDVDQGGYSHTLVYVGEEHGVPTVVHATTKGIKSQPLDDILNMTEVDLMDAYRYIGDCPMQKVVDNARSFVDGEYFFSQLLLGGLVYSIVDEIHKPSKQIRSRIDLTKVAHWIAERLEGSKDKEPMVCVQVATTAFWRADEKGTGAYGIEVKLDGNRKPVKHLLKKLWEVLKEYIELKRGHYKPNFLPLHPPHDVPAIYKAGSKQIPLGTCTLRDLSHSPSLELIGSLKDEQS